MQDALDTSFEAIAQDTLNLSGKSVTARIRIHSILATYCLINQERRPNEKGEWYELSRRHIGVAKLLGRAVEKRLESAP